RVFGQRLEIADAVIARTGLEIAAERQGGKRRIASGAGAADRPPLRIDPPRRREVACAIDAIGDIYNAPVSLQSKPVFPAIPGTAAVIDVQNGKAAARPILRPPAEGRGRRRSRTAVAVPEPPPQLPGHT